MPVNPKMIGLFGLIGGGAALGMVLGSLVDPVPRDLIGASGSIEAERDFDPAPSYQFVEAGPQELGLPAPLTDLAAPAPFEDSAQEWAAESLWPYPEPAFGPHGTESTVALGSRLSEDAGFASAHTTSENPAVTVPEVLPVDEVEASLPAEPPLRESRLAALY